MGLGNTAKRIKKIVELVETLYEQIMELRDQMLELKERLERTDERIESLETQSREQRAILEAVAANQDVDVETAIDERMPEGGDDGDGGPDAGDDPDGATADGEAEASN